MLDVRDSCCDTRDGEPDGEALGVMLGVELRDDIGGGDGAREEVLEECAEESLVPLPCKSYILNLCLRTIFPRK